MIMETEKNLTDVTEIKENESLLPQEIDDEKKSETESEPVSEDEDDDPDSEDDDETSDSEDDDDDDDDETSGGDDDGTEDENELIQEEQKQQNLPKNPFQFIQNIQKIFKKKMPDGVEKQERGAVQQFFDFLLHGVQGAKIRNGELPVKSMAEELLLGLGFKTFLKDVLIKTQALQFWKKKSAGKEDLSLLNTDFKNLTKQAIKSNDLKPFVQKQVDRVLRDLDIRKNKLKRELEEQNMNKRLSLAQETAVKKEQEIIALGISLKRERVSENIQNIKKNRTNPVVKNNQNHIDQIKLNEIAIKQGQERVKETRLTEHSKAKISETISSKIENSTRVENNQKIENRQKKENIAQIVSSKMMQSMTNEQQNIRNSQKNEQIQQSKTEQAAAQNTANSVNQSVAQKIHESQTSQNAKEVDAGKVDPKRVKAALKSMVKKHGGSRPRPKRQRPKSSDDEKELQTKRSEEEVQSQTPEKPKIPQNQENDGVPAQQQNQGTLNTAGQLTQEESRLPIQKSHEQSN